MPLLRETDRHLGICDKPAHCFADSRDPRFIEHSLPVMIRQRVLGLALGYEDLNDHEQLRTDPLLATACEHEHLIQAGGNLKNGIMRAIRRNADE